MNDKELIGKVHSSMYHQLKRKGYATAMIALALKECKKLGIDRVLMCCRKDNIGSAKSIINNGGILENEVSDEDGILTQRYWITV